MVYIDDNYKCHASDGDGLRGFDVPFFDGKCAAFVEGYRYVPEGESWARSDGVVFSGEMIAPWKDHRVLDAAQRQHERAQLAEYEEALELLFSGVTE